MAATASRGISSLARRARRTFLSFFPGGFYDETYLAWERDYKVRAHQQWEETLNQAECRSLLRQGEYIEMANRAVRIESRTNLLFSFEKMALRDAVKGKAGARKFCEGLYAFLYGRGSPGNNFDQWCEVVASLPRKQTRVLTWPVVTVFGFIARPDIHIFFKPKVTRLAAEDYSSRPSWPVYADLLNFGKAIWRDQADLRPRDMIDIQSFIWVLGSDEY